MRKFAGKCVALFLALLMLLTSMPLTALAEAISSESSGVIHFDVDQPSAAGTEGENADNSAGAGSALQVAQEAAKDNPTSGAYVELFRASLQGSNPIKTGDEFNYEIGYQFNAPPTYKDASGEAQPAYSRLTDIQITVTVPDGIEILDAKATHVSGNTYTVDIADAQVGSNPSSGTITLSARIKDNGKVANGTPFAPLDASISATATVDGTDVEFTHELSDAAAANSAVTSAASAVWKIAKTLNGQPVLNADGQTVTITWTIKIGKNDDTNFSGNDSGVYNVEGALNFASFSLTDTLPTIEGKDGNFYKPISSTLTMGGTTLAEGDEGETSLTTTEYAETTLTAGGVNTQTPYYTEYTVTAVYDKAAFVLPFGEEEPVSFTNEASMTYTPVGGSSQTLPASVPGTEGYETPGGNITVFEKLRLVGTDSSYKVVDYESFYSALFTGGATFEVYAADAWDAENGKPKDGATPVDTLTVTNTAGDTTIDLAPGDYYILQTGRPKGTEEPENGLFQKETVESKKTAQATFTNPVKDTGILEVQKVDEAGNKLSGATFVLIPSKGDAITLHLDDSGYGKIKLNPGTYTLRETDAPDNYLTMADMTIKIEEGETLSLTGASAIRNYKDKGTLTITKQIADGTDEGATVRTPSQAGVSEDFTFNIYSSTTGADFTISGDPVTVTIAKGASTVTVDLPVRDESGKLYYYKVVEVKGDNASLDYDTKEVSFNFGGENGAYTTAASATFTNILKSKLVFQKNEKTLSTTTGKDGVQFEIWAGVPNTEGSEKVDTVETANGGVGTTDPLPIRDKSGAIGYYIVEVADQAATEGYTVKYPDGGDYYGPINLSFAATTDVKAKPIVNQKDETQLTVQKTDTAGTPLAGATFTVQNGSDQYAAIDADGKVTWSATETKLTTVENGQIVLTAIPNGAYTVTETGVPDGYLSTGTVSGADGGTATTEGALSGKVTLGTLEKKTITFANEKKPALTFTKSVQGTVSGEFTFELYKANADGTAPEGSSLGSQTVTNGQSATFTVDAAGQYFLKETAWPVGVIAPNLIHTQTGNGVYVDATGVYYGPYDLENDETNTQTITNTPNTGSLTITKVNVKNEEQKLPGATFTVTVDVSGWSPELLALLPEGFAAVEGTTTYTLTTAATNTSGQVTVSDLPVYNGETLISYTVAEATAPANFFKDETPQTKELDGEGYTASMTFKDAPYAKVSITKRWYKQWEADSQNQVDYIMEGAEFAIFEEVEGKLVQVGETLKTDENGALTFEGLNGTKTYYVFELSNPLGLLGEGEKPLADSVETLKKLSAQDALDAYYGVEMPLLGETDDAAEAELFNVETYVQLTLEKWYQPEKNIGTAEKPNWVDDPNQPQTPLDRAKFYLYRCTLDEYKNAGRSITALVGSEEGMAKYRVSDYVYESGISNGAGPGAVVTGALEGGYVYWFNEFEAPAGFITPDYSDSISPVFVPDAAVNGNEISYQNDKTPTGRMENHPEHGPGSIRYLQVMVDKVARSKEGDKDLPNTTFELWLTDSTYTKRLERVAKFTTGVDLPDGDKYGEGEEYMPGRGVSESIQMHKLYEKYGDYVKYIPDESDTDIKNGEYEAYFVLVETSWPLNTTPTSYTYPLHIVTNGENDADTQTDATLNDLYTGENAIVNTLSKQVTVSIKKIGYDLSDKANTTKPLAGAVIGVYSDAACQTEVARGTTGEDGLVYFTLDPITTYYWKEITAPAGYEAVAPSNNSFTTPNYSNSATAEQKPVATVENVLYRKVTLTKVDSEGALVAATFQINKNGAPVKVWLMNDAGQLVESTVGTVATGADGKAEFYLPTGTYTVTETHVGGVELSQAEKAYFSIINNNTTFTIAATDTAKELDFENPGKGVLTILKTDDENKPLEDVQFELYFKAFTKDDYNSATAPQPDAVDGDVKALTGVTISEEALTTGEGGLIALSGLVPGWYRLHEVEGDANENYVLAEDVVVKVTAENFGTPMGEGNTAGSTKVTVINTRKGYLNVSKAYEGVTGFETQTVTFDVYPDENCTEDSEVGSFTVTGAGMATVTSADEGIGITNDNTTLTLDSGIYYVKESTSGDWYTKYALTENAEDFNWLGGANSAPAVVEVTPGNTATVYFTNVGNIADLTFTKKGAQGDASASNPLAGAEFALYYQTGNAKLYWNKTSKQWVSDVESATKRTSIADGTVTFEDVQLPYGVVNGTVTGYAFYVQETKTPAGYAPAADTAVTLTAGQRTTLSDPIVNQKGVVITLTKYDKPCRVEEGRSTLAGAQFTLYRMNADGTKDADFAPQSKTTLEDGAIRFDNLPQLTNGQYYAIQETKTPNGFEEGSLELYDVTNTAAAPRKIPGEDGFFPVATNADVDLNAYNTPLGKIAILKYDYLDPTALPKNATFKAEGPVTLQAHGEGTTAKWELAGYEAKGDHYEKDGISYTFYYIEDVPQGTYTVTETGKPTGYLYTPDAEGEVWSTKQEVEVGNDGGIAVVVFANLPDPKEFDVDIEKDAEYLGEGDLLGDEYQPIRFTLSDFTSDTVLPLENATLKDDAFTFKDAGGKDVTGVEWYVESIVIGAADYEKTDYDYTPSDATIYANLRTKGADGSWSEYTQYAISSEKTVTFAANTCYGVEIVYSNGNEEATLDAGFKAGDVVLNVKARQPDDVETTVPVKTIGNTASIEMTYDFGTMGAQDTTATRTKDASASASTDVADEPALPRVSIEKTSQVQNALGEEIQGETVTPGQRLFYTVTLTGESDEMMEDPILADVLPAGLTPVEGGIEAETDSTTLQITGTQQAGQNVWVTTAGKLAQGDTLTLTILADVSPAALIAGTSLANTAYVFNQHTVPKSVNNKDGSSFADEGGALPSVPVPESLASLAQGGSGMALRAEATNTVASASGITINKLVSVDGKTWYGNEALLVAQKGKPVYYRVTVTNNGGRAITNLRILDVLPYDGDGRSAWGPTLTGAVSGAGTIYYTKERPSEIADTFTNGIGKNTSAEGANAFLAVVEKLEQGKSVTLSYTTTAPADPDNDDYYQLAINTASCMYAEGSSTPLSSADTKVTIMPEAVDLGNRVWIDENMNGVQDEGETKVPGGTTTFYLQPYMEDDPQEQKSTTANEDGYYIFEGLNPAAPQGGNAEYFASGDVDYTSLMGSARATYQLTVSVPAGYRITTPSKTTVEERSNSDSDFALTGETIKFYIPAGGRENGMDDTYDVGLIRMRDLTINKTATNTNGAPVTGVEFDVYGPYYGSYDSDENITVTGEDFIKTIKAGETFTSGDSEFLNAYAYYVIAERVPEGRDYYTGIDSVVGGKTDIKVTGLSEDYSGYFVLEPYAGSDMTGAVEDTVTVTNTYASEGSLTITGKKLFNGIAWEGTAGEYTFALSSKDDPTFTGERVVKVQASGDFSFNLVYDFDTHLKGEIAPPHLHLRAVRKEGRSRGWSHLR